MKIQPNFTNVQSQNFKGIWGKTKIDFASNGNYDVIYKKHYYYPFADETRAEISDIVNKNTSFKKSARQIGRYSTRIIDTYHDEQVEICSKLKFTKKEFENYLKVKSEIEELKDSTNTLNLDA